MCSFWKERFVKNAILWDIISVSILEQGPSPALKSGGLAANEDQYLARNWIDARDAKSWMMMMLCSLIPIGPYFGSGDLSCSRISSLIQIEAKHIKHSNEHSIVPYMSVKGWEGMGLWRLYWWEEKYLSKIGQKCLKLNLRSAFVPTWSWIFIEM